jgi:2-polyprenyl-3-methyl-5-hydroxy-6-metoxy-1,4-benzoquinol methylase
VATNSLAGRARGWLTERSERALASVYYGVLLGRKLPFVDVVAAHVRERERRGGASDAPVPPTAWDTQYAAGRWDFLRDARERERYCTLARCIHEAAPHGAVLDVGCGEGLLLPHLRAFGNTARYTGVDISQVAIDKGRQTFGNDRFICADAERYTPTQSSDVIVFNESLYYFEQPVEGVTRYASFLSPAGIIAVSTYLGSRRARAVRRTLARRHRVLRDVSIASGPHTWNCLLLKPR